MTPQDGFLHFALARLYAKNEITMDKAISELRLAIQQCPDEALFHYHLAHLLYLLGGEDNEKGQYSITDKKLAEKAFEEIKTGNKKQQFTEYLPAYPKDFASKDDYIRVAMLWSEATLPELRMRRALGRESVVLGKLYEKENNEEKALEVYQAILVMGKKSAEQEPLALRKMQEGVIIDYLGFNALEEFYSVRGMEDELQWIQKQQQKLEEIQEFSRKKASELMKHATPSWTKEENELKQKRGEGLLFLEAPFVREMLQIWPTIALPPKLR